METQIIFDEKGKIERIVRVQRNDAHRLIEEFMLLANETVAQHLDDHEVPTLYRIHEKPDPLKVEEFEEFVTTLGYSLAAPPNDVKPRHFQKLVEKMRDIHILGIRSKTQVTTRALESARRLLSVGCGWHPGRHLFPSPAWRMTGVIRPSSMATAMLTWTSFQ